MTIIERSATPDGTDPYPESSTEDFPAAGSPAALAEPAGVEWPVLAEAGRLLLELDPRDLLDNPLNPRDDLGDVSETAESMREVGVLEPLIVVPVDSDGGADTGRPGRVRYMVMFGHRRRAAAIEAGLATVPCDVRPEYAGRSPEQLADMLAENLHRRDLSAVEEAGGYAQLAMFDGWTPERIARRLGRPVDRVRAGVAAAEVSAELRPKVVDGALTLEQAAAIEEFRRREGVRAAADGGEPPARIALRAGGRAAQADRGGAEGRHPRGTAGGGRADRRQAEDLPVEQRRGSGRRPDRPRRQVPDRGPARVVPGTT